MRNYKQLDVSQRTRENYVILEKMLRDHAKNNQPFDMHSWVNEEVVNEIEAMVEMEITDKILANIIHECGSTVCAIGLAATNARFLVTNSGVNYYDIALKHFEANPHGSEAGDRWDSFFDSDWALHDDTATKCADRIRLWLDTGVLSHHHDEIIEGL